MGAIKMVFDSSRRQTLRWRASWGSLGSCLGTCLSLALAALGAPALADYPIVDTGQILCYDDAVAIPAPAPGAPFYGQDAQYDGNPPSFTVSGDGLTVYDEVTGLTWQKSPDIDGDGEIRADDKLSWTDCQAYPASLNAVVYGGFSDWRLPTIKELYSLIDFSGIDPSGYTGGVSGLVPFIDTDSFDFAYGDESAGERLIDSQYASSNLYVGGSGLGQLLFGVNFADGRIKGYGLTMPGGVEKTFFVLCARGNASYGANVFIDNADSTITDCASGLMWQQSDSGFGMTWEDALAHAEALECAGYDDWRLPNAKELQSILDYTRSPSTHGTAAIDPVFSCTAITDEAGDANFPFYWSATTHANWTSSAGSFGVYVCFGEALGYMEGAWRDVHGAGAQRSDPKTGDPASWPYGHGPQGDAIRIYNFVRCVRDVAASDVESEILPEPNGRLNLRAVPNPVPGATTIHFDLPAAESASLEIFDAAGRCLRAFVRGTGGSGVTGSSSQSLIWDGAAADGRRVAAGAYYARLKTRVRAETMTMLIVR